MAKIPKLFPSISIIFWVLVGDSESDSLRHATVRTESNQVRYFRILHDFCVDAGLGSDALLGLIASDLDVLVKTYVQGLLQEVKDSSQGTYVVASLVRHSGLSLHDPLVLVNTRYSLSGWIRLDPDSVPAPFSLTKLARMARWLVAQGSAIHSQAARITVEQLGSIDHAPCMGLPTASVVLPRRSMYGSVIYTAIVFSPSVLVDEQDAEHSETNTFVATVLTDKASFKNVDALERLFVADALLRVGLRNTAFKFVPVYGDTSGHAQGAIVGFSCAA